MPQDNISKSQNQRTLVIPGAIVEDTATALCHILNNSLQRSGQYKDIAALTELEQEGLVSLGKLMIKYEIIPKNMDERLKDIIKLITEEYRKRQLDAFKTFSTRCPYCGIDGSITIVEVALVCTGAVLHPNIPLRSDGFDVSYQDDPSEGNLSTENERVHCNNCGTEFNLSDLVS